MDVIASVLQKRLGEKESRSVICYLPAILMLSIVTLLNYCYYNALSPLLSILAGEFGFNEEQRDYLLGARSFYTSPLGSCLNSIFFLVGCPCSLLFSFIADSKNRKTIFMVISLACHISSFLLQFTHSYSALYWWRGLSGALITSTLPIYLSILSDVFPNSLRSIASVISSVVVGCGMLLGQTVSGFLSSHFSWKFFFRSVSSVGILASCSLFCPFPILA